ncbi:MAG: hypothetical protein QOE11_151 [Solirubrobacteraceae bacterium]|nr:hypothetical protein [Solirubrobacteraceae bacterium]
MPTTTTQRTSRRAVLTAALAVTVALAAPAGALAADPPTVGLPTIIPAGQQSPIDVAGNHLRQHDVIKTGTQLLRWPVATHGASLAPITLTCPDGTVISGFGAQEGSQVYGGPVPGAHMYERTLDVNVRPGPNADPNAAHGHIYALCRDMAVAPLTPALGISEKRARRAGERIPLDVTGNVLRRGAKIRSGAQLILLPAMLFERKAATMTVSCPRGPGIRGIGMRTGGTLAARLARHSNYGRRNLKVRFSPAGASRLNASTGEIYVLCSNR